MSRTFQSLEVRNFRMWFFSNMVASTGTWMQRVAQDWLVLTVLTNHSGTQIGIVTALQFLPLLVLSPWAGVLADRLDRRRLLQWAQSINILLSLILGVLVLTGNAALWHVYVLALAGGVIGAMDSPARQAFVSELVPGPLLPNAVALNSTAFNTARLFGPAISGLVIEWVGTGWVFIVNAILLTVPVIILALMRVEEFQVRRIVERSPGQIREGIAYVIARPDILLILALVFVVSAFGLNFQLTSALMATEVYRKQAGEYGILGSFMAIGALIGSLLAARRRRPRLRMVVIGAGVFGIAEILLGLAPSYPAFALLSIPTGLASLTMITSANATVQITTDERMRGRVMALYTMIFLGATPLGSPTVGWVGEVFGARWSILVGGIASVTIALICALWGMTHWGYRLEVKRSGAPLRLTGPARLRGRAQESNPHS